MRKIIPLLLMLVLFLTACAQPPFAEYPLDDGAVCRMWGSTAGIRRIELTDAEGNTTRFSLSTPDIEPSADGGVEWIDLDFDGHDDLRIRTKRYVDGDYRYACFLWRDGTLVESTALGRMRALTADAERQMLFARELHVSPDEYESEMRLGYVWHNGNPVAVEKRELIHYTVDEIYYFAEYTAEAGRPLEMVREKWIFADQYDPDTVWN